MARCCVFSLGIFGSVCLENIFSLIIKVVGASQASEGSFCFCFRLCLLLLWVYDNGVFFQALPRVMASSSTLVKPRPSKPAMSWMALRFAMVTFSTVTGCSTIVQLRSRFIPSVFTSISSPQTTEIWHISEDFSPRLSTRPIVR